MRGEEGQVTPALLLAIIGGFAIAVAFVSLQNLLDQTGRASTASDAAALAAGTGHRQAVTDFFDGNNGLHLGQLAQVLEGGAVPDAQALAEQEARDYADANGADVLSVTYDRFDLGKRQWEYTVVTRQQDEVKGGTSTAHTHSRSRVAVRIASGVCPGGLIVGGGCRPFDLLEQLCGNELAPPPSPTPSPTPDPSAGPSSGPSASPSPEPSPSPTFSPPPGLEGVGCLDGADLRSLITFDIRLIN